MTQGEVFFATPLLADLEGLERGPAGNTSLAAAMALAREFGEDEIVVVQETEYTGAGKHPTAQLTLARDLGISVGIGRREDDRPGERIVFPAGVDEMSYSEVDLSQLRRSYLRRVAARVDDRGIADSRSLPRRGPQHRSGIRAGGVGVDRLAPRAGRQQGRVSRWLRSGSIGW